ncbi:MAG TPA: hypothetical protein VJW73_02825 [Gemmatimonadaceae bacterium]|nr:hypothetical protein [Gemmatimonadaceae bacterium]
MISATLALAASLLASSGDTISRDSLLNELPAVLSFSLVLSQGDTIVNGMFLAHPPPTAFLAQVQAELPFALTWLLEGAAGYDRRRLLQEFGLDTAAMRRAFIHSILNDTSFTQAVVRVSAPILEAHGTHIAGALPFARTVLTRAQATALAARFFQIVSDDGRLGVTICAKPSRLRDRPTKRDDVVEAWFYSAVRPTTVHSTLADGALAVLREMTATESKTSSKSELEQNFWRRWERDPRLWKAIARAYSRTKAWAPISLPSNR